MQEEMKVANELIAASTSKTEGDEMAEDEGKLLLPQRLGQKF
jgi:hypothetical protein